MTENRTLEEEFETPLKKRKLDEQNGNEGRDQSISPSSEVVVVSSTTIEDERNKADVQLSAKNEETNKENDLGKQVSITQSDGDSSVGVNESISVTSGSDQTNVSSNVPTPGKESRHTVEELIALHSQQIGLVMHDPASFTKVLKNAVAKRVTKALRQETASLEKKIVWLENQNRELQWKAKKLSITCRQTKERSLLNSKQFETEDKGTQVNFGMNLTHTVPATLKASQNESCNSLPVLSQTLSTSQSLPKSNSQLEPQSQARPLTYSNSQIQLQANMHSQVQSGSQSQPLSATATTRSVGDALLTKSSPAVGSHPTTSLASAYQHNQQQKQLQQQRLYSLQRKQQQQLHDQQQQQNLRLLLQQKQIRNQPQPQPQQRKQLLQQSWQGQQHHQQNPSQVVQQTEQQLRQKIQQHHQHQVQQKQLLLRLHNQQQRQGLQQQQMQQRNQNPQQAGRIGELNPQQSQVYTMQQQQQRIQLTNVTAGMAPQQINSSRTVVLPSHTLQQPIRQQMRFGQHHVAQQVGKQPVQQISATPSVQQSVTQPIQVGTSASFAKPVEHLGTFRTVQQPVAQQIRPGVPLSLQQPVLPPSQPLAVSGVQSFPKQSADPQVVVIPDSPPDMQQQSSNPTQTEEHNRDGLFHHWKLTTSRSSQHFNSQLPRNSTQDKNHLGNQQNHSSIPQLSAQNYQIQPSSQALTQTVSSYYHPNTARSIHSHSSSEAARSQLINTSVRQQPTVVTAKPTSQQSAAHFQTLQRQQPSSGTMVSSRHMPEQQHGISAHSPQLSVNHPQASIQYTNLSQATAPVKSSGLPSSEASTMPTSATNNPTQHSFFKQNVDQDPDIIITSVVSQKDKEIAKKPPGKPSVSISVTENGIVLSWTMELEENGATIDNYELFTLQDDLRDVSPSSSLPWKKIGKLEAMPLPMACTLTQFLVGNNYHFAVRAVDVYGRAGPFSDACTAILSNTEPDQ